MSLCIHIYDDVYGSCYFLLFSVFYDGNDKGRVRLNYGIGVSKVSKGSFTDQRFPCQRCQEYSSQEFPMTSENGSQIGHCLSLFLRPVSRMLSL